MVRFPFEWHCKNVANTAVVAMPPQALECRDESFVKHSSLGPCVYGLGADDCEFQRFILEHAVRLLQGLVQQEGYQCAARSVLPAVDATLDAGTAVRFGGWAFRGPLELPVRLGPSD